MAFKIESYDDVVPAREIHDRLLSGTLVGDEARFVTIRFDYTRVGSTSSMAAESNGVYTDYHATSNLSYVSWLDGDGELFHEYGHAWSLYTLTFPTGSSLSAYLAARELLTDPRVNSSYSWNARELIAEDYRQLFGSPNARAVSQLNRELPPPSAVPGLRDFLATTFTVHPPKYPVTRGAGRRPAPLRCVTAPFGRYGWAFGMLMLAECGLETWFADRRSLFAPAVSPQSPAR